MLDLRSLTPWGRKNEVTVKKNEVTDPFVSFRNEMDRLFDNFFQGFPAAGRTGTSGAWSVASPNIDVSETEKEITISAELPGMDEKDFEVTLINDVLTLKGEKKYEHEEKEGERHYVERSYGSFSRSIRLPFEAGEQDVKADFDKGVLKISIAKPAEIQSRVKRIEVKTS